MLRSAGFAAGRRCDGAATEQVVFALVAQRALEPALGQRAGTERAALGVRARRPAMPPVRDYGAHRDPGSTAGPGPRADHLLLPHLPAGPAPVAPLLTATRAAAPNAGR